MGLMKKYDRRGAAIYRTPQWAAVRLEAKRRDGWRCVQCGGRGRLEVDHIKGVGQRPDLAYHLPNLQTLCVSCHSRKTRAEVLGSPDPAREAWADLLRKDLKCSNL